MSTISEATVPWAEVERLNLGAATVRVLKRLESYDLSDLTSNFINKGRKFSPEQVWPIQEHFGKADIEIATLLEREFKRFVALTVMFPKHVYAPSGPVDMYWHFFILHTRDYKKFCDQIWGASPGTRAARENVSQGSKSISLVPPASLKGKSERALSSLAALEAYDLEHITSELIDVGRRFAPEQVWPIKAHFGKADLAVARLLEGEFKRFAALTILDETATFAPSGPVDMYWHFLILHTDEYRAFCDAIWGEFQHHPRGSRGGEPSNDAGRLQLSHDGYEHGSPGHFDATVDAYSAVFGRYDTAVWVDPTANITRLHDNV